MADFDLQAAEVARTTVEQYLGQPVAAVSIKPIAGGSVNQVFEYADELVIRVGLGRRAPATFDKEKWCIERAQQLEVLTPGVLLIRQQEPYVAMVQTKVFGSPGVRLTGDAFKAMWRELGRYSKLLHSVSTPGFGDRFLTSNPTSSSWQQWVDFQRSNLLDDASLWRGLIGRRQLVRIRERFGKLRELEFEPVLCHANIGERNAIVDHRNNVYLLDWGNAGGYPGYWDLAEVVAWNETGHSSIQCFCQGYEMTHAQSQDLKDQLLLVQTWRWLSSIRWSMDANPNWKKAPVVQLALANLKKSIRWW